ncbi:MAG: hypothetical protein QNJ67_12265 [Kiloniellales bacterium]|nr:hypothetical protein [Kiloniellales bacterium]
MTFSYWIQRHDYSAENFGDVTADEAIRAYADYDWGSELAAYDEDSDDRDCPPGIGFHNGYDGSNPEGMLLHICPLDATTVFLNFQRKTARRLLGVFPVMVDDVHYAEAVQAVLVPDLIRSLFALDPEPILRRCD